MGTRRSPFLDAILYAVSFGVALIDATVLPVPSYRLWGRVVVGIYALGTVIALRMARHRSGDRARRALLVGIVCGVVLLPLGLGLVVRNRPGGTNEVQPEVLVPEQAAAVVLKGHDPYPARLDGAGLSTSPIGTQSFPYLPGMLLFGLPWALVPHVSFADARVGFTLVTFAAAFLALRKSTLSGPARHTAALVLLALPAGALPLATGGDDMPVVALLLLAFALAARKRPLSAGLAIGVAAVVKQTAWLVVPFLVLAVAGEAGRRAGRRALTVAAGVAGPIILGFFLWDPRSFVQNAIRYPLGIGKAATPAQTPTIGSVLIHSFPAFRFPLTVMLIGIVAVAGLLLLGRRPLTTSQACTRAGLLWALAIGLAPAARVGYIVYPINLLVWGWLFHGAGSGQEDAAPAPALDPEQEAARPLAPASASA